MTDSDSGAGDQALAPEGDVDAAQPGIRILAQFIRDLKLSATAKRDDGPVFVVELLYGGVFQITGVGGEDVEPVLLVECPRYLFPFARRIIAEVTSEGGYPPFLLDPIDFAAVYIARKGEAGVQVGHA